MKKRNSWHIIDGYTAEFEYGNFERWLLEGMSRNELVTEEIQKDCFTAFVYISEMECRKMLQTYKELKSLIAQWAKKWNENANKIKTISIEYHAEHLFADGSDYDEDTVDKFSDNLMAALEKEYPDADIEIEMKTGVEGPGGGIWVNNDDRHPECQNIEYIISECPME